MAGDESTTAPSLDRATTKRRELAAAMADLERIVAGPASAGDWLDRVEVALAELKAALDGHIEEVEAPDGLLAEIDHEAPQLGWATKELREEHIELLGAWVRAEASVRLARNDGPQARDAVRRRVVSLIGRLTRHRQAGSDLVFEAYHVDIGGLG